MTIDEKDFNKIADELASGEAGAQGTETSGTRAEIDRGKNANDQLRHILGEASGQVTGNGTPEQDNAADSANAANSADAADLANTAEDTVDHVDPAGAEAPDPSLVNWAKQMWRTPGTAYDSRNSTYIEPATVKKDGAARAVRTALITILCLAVGIVAALQFKTIASKTASEPDSEEQIKELLSTINNMHSELGSLEAERDELQNRLDLVEQSSQDEQIASLRDELNRVRTFAGLTSVKGRGIHIQLNFTERTNINSIQNRLLLLINELRASGAQAISINGIRILGMTEIRVVSDQYISVGARQLVAPYDIYAIGEASNLYSGITMGGSGIVFQIRDLSGTTCTWDIQENIIVNAASDEDIKTDLLTSNP